MLPLDRWEAPARAVRLGGRRTCDSDDFFPRPSQPPLMLPEDGQGMVVAIFGVGAYQQMISGRGGAHHCLNPEMRRIIIEQDGDALVVREIAPQSLGAIMGLARLQHRAAGADRSPHPGAGPGRAAHRARAGARRRAAAALAVPRAHAAGAWCALAA